ncbi:hypothetical protein [Streptomyces sp. NPDC007083]|uniref:hypothetical protein n=1 Tax=Streptomyces sp. NPDC007083 TaxID=3156913 RepID=UPI0033E39984
MDDTSSGSWSPEWVGQIPDMTQIPMLDSKKDEFIHHLFEYFQSEYHYGYSAETKNEPGVGVLNEWKLETPAGSELPRLWIIDRPDSLILALAGVGAASEGDVDTWRRGLNIASSRMGSRIDISWVAILAQPNPGQFDLQAQRLEGSEEMSDLNLRTLGCVAEDVYMPNPSMGVMARPFVHWPIEVRGSTQCFKWDQEGEVDALRRLRTISALLSLYWDKPWVLREGPWESYMAEAVEEARARSGPWREATDYPFQGIPIEVPSWLPEAERIVSQKSRLASALLIHHEGLSLMREHSSVALVCFTSAIEATAQVQKKPKRCQECGSTLSSRRRFEEAVGTVLDEEQAEPLVSAYKERSQTVHQGRLHGIEVQANTIGRMSLFENDDLLRFSLTTVGSARKASRELLLAELKGK